MTTLPATRCHLIALGVDWFQNALETIVSSGSKHRYVERRRISPGGTLAMASIVCQDQSSQLSAVTSRRNEGVASAQFVKRQNT